MSPGGDDVFQRLRKESRCVEGAVKGDLHGMSELHQGASPFDVHGSIRPQHTENDTRCSQALAVEDVFAHQCNLWLGVEEVTAAGSNEDVHGKTAALDSSTDEAMAGGDAAFAEAGAELNTVGAAFFRCKTGVDCFGTEFEDHLAGSLVIGRAVKELIRVLAIVDLGNDRDTVVSGSRAMLSSRKPHV